ncbi:MAG TPA: protein kinase [Polyangiales bacterium]|nr:protein kinase [Polyangiales bacterium]
MTLGGPGSEVFRGRSVDGDRYVAVRLWCGTNPSQVADALARVKLASRVSHPTLARVEACEARGNAALWIVSEYVPGPSLDAWSSAGRRLPLASAIELVRNVSLGAHAAIREGIVHHSIQPSNLVIWRQDRSAGLKLDAKLLDLGMAAWMQPEPPQLEAAHFMAPETLHAVLDERDPSAHIDARSNVYSCGALLYYLATGALPFRSSGLAELADAHAEGKLWAPRAHNPQISAAFETVILGALSVRRSGRYANPGELASALDAVLWRDSLEPPKPTLPKLPPRKIPREAALAKTQKLPPVALPELSTSDTTLRSRLSAWSAIRNLV